MPTNSSIIKGQNKGKFKKVNGTNKILVTPGEFQFITRRRTGLTVKQYMMQTLGHARGPDAFRAAEYDEDRFFRKLPIRPSDLKEMLVTDGEFCILQRRRRRWGMEDAEAALQVSRVTISKAEHDRTVGVKNIKQWYLRHGMIEALSNVPENFGQ